MNINPQLNIMAPLVDSVSPGNKAAGTINSNWISMKDAVRLLYTLSLGTIAATATVDMKLQEATDNAGAGAKDIPLKLVTQLVTGGSDDRVMINITGEELDVNNSFSFVRAVIVVGTDVADLGLAVQSSSGRYAPRAQEAAVVEVID